MSQQKKLWCVFFSAIALWALCYQAWDARGRVEVMDSRASLGALDTKFSDIQPNGLVMVRGWAVHPGGVAQARVFVDGRYASRLEIYQTRPDVRSAYPTLPGALHSGFFAKIPLKPPLKEHYEIRVDLKLHNGKTSTLGPWRLAR